MKTTDIYMDSEFTGIRKDTTLVSIGLVSQCGKTFYAELADYNKNHIDDWLQENVVDNLILQNKLDPPNGEFFWNNDNLTDFRAIGLRWMIGLWLEKWFMQFENVNIWGDHISYDWVLFTDLFQNKDLKFPTNVSYIPFDLCTLFKEYGIDPDISREEFVGDFTVLDSRKSSAKKLKKHNSLYDAYIIRQCVNKVRVFKDSQPKDKIKAFTDALHDLDIEQGLKTDILLQLF